MSQQVSTPRRRLWIRLALYAGIVVLAWLAIAYVLMPTFWVRYAHRHPALDNLPRVTYTGDDIPDDPLNVALIGTELAVKTLFLAAHWYPADPLTLRSCLEIAADSVHKRPYMTTHRSASVPVRPQAGPGVRATSRRGPAAIPA
jgi:hypothetical protein